MHPDPRIALGITLALLGLACGGGGSTPPAPSEPAPAALEPAKPAEPPPTAAAPTPAAPAPPDVTATPDASGVVHLQAGDQMRYSSTRIEVPAGKVKIELKNAGVMPKEAMGHNLCVLKPGTDPMGFAVKQIAAKATDYVVPGQPELLAHTKSLGPGESEMLEVELAAGTYPFLCTFPGHVGLMNGQIIAK